MMPISEKIFNSLKWDSTDGRELDKLLAGLSFIGSEPTEYPNGSGGYNTDGLIIYFKKPCGDVLAIDLGLDIFSEPQDSPFMMHLATIPARDIQSA